MSTLLIFLRLHLLHFSNLCSVHTSVKLTTSQRTEGPPQAAMTHSEQSRPLVKAVRISCDGERNAGVGSMAQHDIPADHDIFRKSDISEISKLIGIPLKVCKVWPGSSGLPSTIPSSSAAIFTVEKAHYNNVDAGCIMHELDPDFSKNFDEFAIPFKIPKRWCKNNGGCPRRSNRSQAPLQAPS